jgi:hypothetical protein
LEVAGRLPSLLLQGGHVSRGTSVILKGRVW